MLTVVGIIAVLVSVSIPIVNSSLEKAQKATDAANERAAKGAMMMESLLTENTGGTPMYYDNAAGQWKTDPPSAGYGKCDAHKGCYLRGTMNSSGEVVLEWMKTGGTPVTTLCSETLMAESGGGSTPPIPEVPAGIKQGDFYVQGRGYEFSSTTGVLTINSSEKITISSDGKKTDNRIVVADGVNAEITLDNVNIECSSGSALDVGTGNVTIILKQSNVLKSSCEEAAGLQKCNITGKLIINGDGELIATGNGNAAGIGGNGNNIDEKGDNSNDVHSSNIEILGGKITAIGGSNGGAGIGGGKFGNGCNITIKITADGDKVEAQGQGGGEDIGDGYGSTKLSGGNGITVNDVAYTNRKTDTKTTITKATTVNGDGSIN